MSTRQKNKNMTRGDKRVTIDAKHNEQVKQFRNLKKKVPELEKQIKVLSEAIDLLEDKLCISDQTSNEYIKLCNAKMEYEDKIQDLEREIANINDEKMENNYYLSAGPYVMAYFVNKNNISKGTIIESNDSKENLRKPGVKHILDFFKQPKKDEKKANKTNKTYKSNDKPNKSNDESNDKLSEQDKSYKLDCEDDYDKCDGKSNEDYDDCDENKYDEESDNSDDCIEYDEWDMLGKNKKTNEIPKLTFSEPKKSKKKSEDDFFDSRSSTAKKVKLNNAEQSYHTFSQRLNSMPLDKINDRYMNAIDKNYISKDTIEEYDIDYCYDCQTEMKLHQSDGRMVCPSCGIAQRVLVESDKQSCKDPPKEVVCVGYRRINHFRECVAQVQAKETTDIPDELYDQIIFELKKERFHDMAKLTLEKLKEILKKIKKTRYYEHGPHIINQLNGLPPPTYSKDLQVILDRMFNEIQIPFQKYRPRNRKNFLSYSYVLYKFFELLDMKEYCKNFNLLKSREKLYAQDLIWKKITKALGWRFIKSI